VYHVRAALDGGLDTPEVHLLHARVWLRAGRPERALDILRKREHRLPEKERGDFWHAYGQAALAADELETSLRCLKQAVTCDPVRYEPSLLEAYRALADRYSRRGDLAAYVRCLEAACDLAARDPELHYRLGNAYWEAGRHADAARQWQITLELDPDHPQRARLLDRLRRVPES
jgi:tetratricopeptide (TPR) repeat protein